MDVCINEFGELYFDQLKVQITYFADKEQIWHFLLEQNGSVLFLQENGAKAVKLTVTNNPGIFVRLIEIVQPPLPF